jgi:hypothetical protein
MEINIDKTLDEYVEGLCDTGVIYTEIDGYNVLWVGDGYLPSYVLRYIADQLDKMNQPWDDLVNEYFETHKSK